MLPELRACTTAAIPTCRDLQWKRRQWSGAQAYSDSKLFDLVLALAVARRWPGVRSNAVEPGWVATKMGGPGAPDDLDARRRHAGVACHQRRSRRHLSPAAASTTAARVAPTPAAADAEFQDGLLGVCAELTEVTLPDG